MTRFWWVRHGPTHARCMVGWTDLPADLSDTALIARVADFLPEAPVISSDLSRAAATADAIAGLRPRLPPDPDLREINFGAWEMRSFAEVEAEDPARIRAYYETPGDIRPPRGESWHQLSARVSGAVDRLVQVHAGRDLILVAHLGAILTQVQRARGLSAYDAIAQQIDNLSVTRIGFDGRWRAEIVNHLP